MLMTTKERNSGQDTALNDRIKMLLEMAAEMPLNATACFVGLVCDSLQDKTISIDIFWQAEDNLEMHRRGSHTT